MTIQKISPCKLQVFISANDITALNVSRDDLTYNSPAAQSLIGDIMLAATTQVGFKPVGEDIVVEASPRGDEGIDVFLTVVSQDLQNKKEEKVKSDEMTILQVGTRRELAATCLHLSYRYFAESYLFKLKDSFYIALRTDCLDKHAACDYGVFVDNSDTFFGYLKENGEMLVGGDLFCSQLDMMSA